MVVLGIEALSQLPFFYRLLSTRHLSQKHRVLVVCIRVAGSKLDGSLVFLFSSQPVPVVGMSNRSESAVGFCDGIIKLQCFQNQRLRQRYPIPGRQSIAPPSFPDSKIGGSVIRVLLHGLAEILFGFRAFGIHQLGFVFLEHRILFELQMISSLQIRLMRL